MTFTQFAWLYIKEESMWFVWAYQKMGTATESLWVVLLLSLAIVGLKGDEDGIGIAQGRRISAGASFPPPPRVPQEPNRNYTDVVVNKKNKYYGDGGAYGWGWGGGGGGGGGGGKAGGGGGWGWGGGGGGWWGSGCRRQGNYNGRGRGRGRTNNHKKRAFKNGDYVIGRFAQCMGRGRCRGMRLECPLHCGGPCFYDCRHMCKAHCQRS